MTAQMLHYWVITAGLFCALLAGFYVIRRRDLRRHQRDQDALWRILLDAQERERRRIASELHNSLGQNILVIKNRALLGLELGMQSEVQEQFEQIIKASSLAMDEVRHIVHNLSTHQLQQLGLTQAIEAMIDLLAASTSLRFDRQLESVDDVCSPEAALNLYRIIQEALNNVVKHAHASRVTVQLIRDVHHLRLVVRDDGRGFEPATIRDSATPGMGLKDIVGRIRLLSGKEQIESQPNQGTTLSVTIPLREGIKL